jgi:hypothetical protein
MEMIMMIIMLTMSEIMTVACHAAELSLFRVGLSIKLPPPPPSILSLFHFLPRITVVIASGGPPGGPLTWRPIFPIFLPSIRHHSLFSSRQIPFQISFQKTVYINETNVRSTPACTCTRHYFAFPLLLLSS